MSCVRSSSGFGCYDNVTFQTCQCGTAGVQVPNFPIGGGNGGGGDVPIGVGNAGGWPGGQQGQLAQILNSILSGVALIQGANYVPTPLQSGQTPQGATGQVQYYPQYPIGYNQGSGNYTGGNAAGAFQRYIEAHPMVVAAIAVGGVLLLLPRPTMSRRNGLKRRSRRRK